MSSVREKLEEYFSSMNPTSSRLMADIKKCKQEYDSNFEELDSDQQSEILWKCLVKPEAIKMYENVPENSVNVEYFPVLRIRPGAKVIVEEDNVSTRSFGNSWRDEHSSPFCWETMSQLGLDEDETIETEDGQPNENLAEVQESEKCQDLKIVEVKKEEEVKKSATIKRPEVPPPPVPPHATPLVPPHVKASPPQSEKKDMPIYAKILKRKSLPKTLGSAELKALRRSKEEVKPAVPPRMSLELKGSIDVTKYKTLPIDIDDIPKTGFDFLDNW